MKENAFKYHVLKSNQILSIIISGHLLIEKQLINILEKSIPKPDILLKGNGLSFSRLIDLNEALGIIESDLANVLRAFNRIRNKYAHNLSYCGNENVIDSFLDALRAMREPFFISAVTPSEKELAFAMSSLIGWFELKYGKIEL